jgi:hypothetical protein
VELRGGGGTTGNVRKGAETSVAMDVNTGQRLKIEGKGRGWDVDIRMERGLWRRERKR